MKQRRFWKGFFLAATLLTACLIFFFSAQQGPDSAQLSEGVTLQVARVVKPDYPSLPAPARQSFLSQLGLVIRKLAHFSEFALLGLNLTAYLNLRRPDRSPLRLAPAAWGVATLYACTDELHQMFVSERGPAVLDVLIDSGGAATGALLATLAAAVIRRRIGAGRTQ